MSLRFLLRTAFTILFPLAVISTTYLYLYPLFHGCAFAVPDASSTSSYLAALFQHTPFALKPEEQGESLAPFRLLVFGDPQLEGDSSLPDHEDGLIARLGKHWVGITADALSYDERFETLRSSASDIVGEDIPRALRALRKRVDLFGNDYYLAHIYRTLYWWSRPTHVAVLGDLIGSQWVTDDEFDWRGWRYWNRVFRHGRRVEDEITAPRKQAQAWTELDALTPLPGQWARRVINIAGNHDIGYAGDISPERIARFNRIFGRVNWDIRFRLPSRGNVSNQATESVSPTLHLVVLNDLSLDTPSLSFEVQDETYSYINSVITSAYPVEDRSSFTLLLTHVPLHKPAGVCVDAPFFDFYNEDDNENRYKSGGLKEQNHLSEHVSKNGILEGVFGISTDRNAPAEGKGRPGLIMTGHDHEGCDAWHHIPSREPAEQSEEGAELAEPPLSWESIRWQDANISSSHSGVREVTLRSMMGEFGGNAGLFSAWFDFDHGEWKFELRTCKAGVQHIWWAVHVIDIVALIIGMALILFGLIGSEIPIDVAQKSLERKESATKGGLDSRGRRIKAYADPQKTRKTGL